MDTPVANLRQHFRGVILGTAVGDAIGLPREGLSTRRATRMFGTSPLRHRLLFGHGMTSDDTEHTCMTAQALLASGGDPKAFARSLAWRLRGWLIGLPAGVGMATAKSCIKLWLGFPPHRSGVWSAGNGPAMRAAIIGVWASEDLTKLQHLISVSTRITHADLAAEHGAMAIALAAAYATRSGDSISPRSFLSFVEPFLTGTPMSDLLVDVVDRVESGTSFDQYLADRKLQRGISGYINHTVPACLFCWLQHPHDFRQAVEQVIVAGGDADTTGAIAGALAGITAAGHEDIPPAWLNGLLEWPRSVKWMERLAERLADVRSTASADPPKPQSLFWPGLLLRNVLFLVVVLTHGVRRLLPPY